MPSPVARGARKGFKPGTDDEVELPCDASAPTALFVFKTIYDQFSGRVNLVRIFSGKIATDTQLLNERTGEKERTGNILLMQGKETKTIEEAGAGDIVALAQAQGDRHGRHPVRPGAAGPLPAVSSSRRRPSPSPSRPRPAATKRRSPTVCVAWARKTRPWA